MLPELGILQEKLELQNCMLLFQGLNHGNSSTKNENSVWARLHMSLALCCQIGELEQTDGLSSLGLEGRRPLLPWTCSCPSPSPLPHPTSGPFLLLCELSIQMSLLWDNLSLASPCSRRAQNPPGHCLFLIATPCAVLSQQ